jgi:CheY-like chemotaxis protein
MRRMVADGLRRDGYFVEEIADGMELLERIGRAGEEPLDLVVSDVLMPGNTGIEALLALRNPFRVGVCETPVILITAFADDEVTDQAERLGAILFAKPFDVDDLRTAAINLVQPRRVSTP